MKHAFEEEYRRLVVPYAPPIGSPRRIIVPEVKVEQMQIFAKQIAQAKMEEEHHRIDGASEYRRQLTGLIGEAAIEEFFGISFIDFSIGNSKKYNVADMKRVGLNVGIKTVEPWKFPVVHKDPYRPELICVKRKDNEVLLFGYASIDVLRLYQTDKYILDENLRRRGTKSAFYGFAQLVEINSFAELQQVYKTQHKGGYY